MRSGAVWSAGFQPTGAEPDEYSIHFNEERAEIMRRDGTLTTTLEVLVSAEDDAEVRRVSITNAGGRSREIEITSYAELALGPQGADVAHPAFAKLFVETEYLADSGAILATRRKRTPSEPEIWAAHLSVANGEAVSKPEFETDRARFLGRGHSVSAPIAMLDARSLTNSIGAVLDPIFALRRRVRVAPGRRFASHSGRWRQRRAPRCWIVSTSIATRRPMNARRRLPGPKGKFSFIIWA